MAQKLKVKVINVEADPRASGRTVISLLIDDHSGKKPYIKAFSLVNPQEGVIFTEEQFLDMVIDQDLSRPKDPWGEVKAMMNENKEHELDLSRNLKGE